MDDAAVSSSPAGPGRLLSLDAYRGFAMFLMAAELLRLPETAEHFPGSQVWQVLGRHWEHVEWTGCTLHDLIQPSFSFMVGVALPFSLAGRRVQGASRGRLWAHACVRGLILVLLGVFLRSIGSERTNWTFEDTLSQIGLGYPILFALGMARWRTVWISLGTILAGYWALFALWPLPGPGFDYQLYGVPENWGHHFSGFAAHWNINSNAAWAFDRWFMNLFPRSEPFMGNGGGYSTLSFIPTLGTMILGLCAGRWILSGGRPAAARLATVGGSLVVPEVNGPMGEADASFAAAAKVDGADRSERSDRTNWTDRTDRTSVAADAPLVREYELAGTGGEEELVFRKEAAVDPAVFSCALEVPENSGVKSGGMRRGAPMVDGPGLARGGSWKVFGILVLAGVVSLGLGYGWDVSGWGPSVKKIWTPSWTLFSGGWCFLLMAGFYLVADLGGIRRPLFPLVVIGMNSIAMYVLVHTVAEFFETALVTHFGQGPFAVLGPELAPMLRGAAVLLILWGILRWMYGRRLFLRV
ncbi:MAG: hypothetical protein JWL81_1738 [Verrucomicrobiales bacterium]|nr:hypothetical protein [Verrucomicrobiales bacterium]